MATANTIESFFSLINSPEHARSGSLRIQLRPGELIELPSGRNFRVVSGQLWLTHRGDPADHFPSDGDSFNTTRRSHSLIEALADSTILIQ